MANVIIKSDDRRRRQKQILRDFGRNSQTATKEDRERAEYIAEKVSEMKKNWRD